MNKLVAASERNIPLVLLIFFFPLLVLAQTGAGIDTMIAFKPGIGQNVGQQAPYFPGNIFGLPDTSARESMQVSAPESICSLGLGGEIIVGFRHRYLVNRPGPDFTVFENAFRIALGNLTKTFAEPAVIAVSRDGIHFVEFPFDSLTLAGCAGVTPVHGDANPFDPSVSGGDSFDLEQIGMDSIRFIRIRDISAMVKDNRSHPYWDPTISGFDLDAIAGLSLLDDGTETHEQEFSIHIATSSLTVVLQQSHSEGAYCELYSLQGRKLSSFPIEGGTARIDARFLWEGMYLLAVHLGERVLTRKILWME